MTKNFVGALFGLALVSILGTMATAQQKTSGEAAPVFEAVSIKPNTSDGTSMYFRSGANGFLATNCTLQKLIRVAYGAEDDQVAGGPNWLNSLRYDIEARTDSSVVNELQKRTSDQRKVVVDSMLPVTLDGPFQVDAPPRNQGDSYIGASRCRERSETSEGNTWGHLPRRN